MADRVGQQFGDYRLERLLGEGGFAEVYLGKHLYLKTKAAIKVLAAVVVVGIVAGGSLVGLKLTGKGPFAKVSTSASSTTTNTGQPAHATVKEFGLPLSNSEPYGITVGPDGNLWFTEFSGNRIGRITSAGQITEFLLTRISNDNPLDITAGPDGNLWFTERYGNKIGWISPGA